MVNTIHAYEVEYIICKKEKESMCTPEYFKVEPESSICNVTLPQFKSLPLMKVFMIYLPINYNISTTGHKLQGETLDSLVVNSWAYYMPHWISVSYTHLTLPTKRIV